MTSVDRVGGADQGRAVRELDRFRGEFFGCLGRRADELVELLDALLCAEGPVSSLVGLCLAPEHRRGHGALYAAVNRGELDTGRLRETLGALPCRGCSAGGSCSALTARPGYARRADLFRAAVLPRLWPRPRARCRPADP